MDMFIQFSEFLNAFFHWYMVICIIGGWVALAYLAILVSRMSTEIYELSLSKVNVRSNEIQIVAFDNAIKAIEVKLRMSADEVSCIHNDIAKLHHTDRMLEKSISATDEALATIEVCQSALPITDEVLFINDIEKLNRKDGESAI